MAGPNAEAWSAVREQLSAAYARRDAWEAEAEDPDEDGRPLPDGLRSDVEEAENALIKAEAPDWSGVADKLRILLPFVDDGVWEPDWQPNPAAHGMPGAAARLLIAAELIGSSEPSRRDALRAAFAAEDLAYTAVTSLDGYRNYAINPPALADMAAIIGSIQEDARRLNRAPGLEGLSAAAIDAVWCGDRIFTAQPVERGTGPDLRPQLERMGAIRSRTEELVQ